MQWQNVHTHTHTRTHARTHAHTHTHTHTLILVPLCYSIVVINIGCIQFETLIFFFFNVSVLFTCADYLNVPFTAAFHLHHVLCCAGFVFERINSL